MEYGRIFDDARKAQGFKSQEHLDAFYAHYDHTKACPECQKAGEPVWIIDSWQPTMNECEEGKRLYLESAKY